MIGYKYLVDNESFDSPPNPVEQNSSEQPIDVALRLAGEGIPVFPCRSQDAATNGKKAKSPLTKNGFKGATTDEHTIRFWWAKWPGAAIGMPTGRASGLFVLDVDKKNGCDGEASLVSLMQEHGPLPPTKRVDTPTGGFHLYFQVPDGVKILCSAGKLGPGIDVRGDGGYVICEEASLTDENGSVIGRYEHVSGSPDVPATAPDWLMRKLTEQPEPAKPLPQSRSSNVSSWASIKLKEQCACVAQAEPGTRNDMLNKAAFAVGQLIGKRALERGEVEGPLTTAARASGLEDGEIRATIASGIGAGLAKADDRLCFPDKSRKGFIDPRSLRNVEALLAWIGVSLRWNSFIDRYEITGLKGHRHLSDKSLAELWGKAHEFDFRASKNFLRDCLEVIALRREVHPVRDYFAALNWDGIDRLNMWLTAYLKAEDNLYTAAVGAKTLIAAVRRIIQPGTKFDQMLILEGEQGTGKSSAAKILAIKEVWFTDCVSLMLDTKRLMEQTEGKVIVEVAELKGMKKGEIDHVKVMLSCTRDRARKAYGRYPEEVSRQFILIGTTNTEKGGECSYLKDPTGNRRFWPVRTGKIDLERLEHDRDQLWAEAVAREAAGESIELPRELWEVAQREQEARMERDPWLDELANALGDKQGKLLTTDARRIVSPGAERWWHAQDERLGRVMRELGRERRELRTDQSDRGRAYFYVKGKQPWRELVVYAESNSQVTVYVKANEEWRKKYPGMS